MTAVRRRDLTALLAVPGGALLGTACSPGAAPVPTSPDIDRDPLADLDPQLWPARSGPEMLELPIEGETPGSEPWSGLNAEDALEPARKQLVDFLTTAYLEPGELSGLDDSAARERVSAVTPRFWQEDLSAAWDGGDRYFYAIAFAEPYRVVGRPAIAVQWLRGDDDAPTLLVGGTIAWTVLEATTRAIGVIAYRYGIVAALDTDGSMHGATLRTTINGLDRCQTAEEGGVLVPALADSDAHRAAQERTLETVIGSPQVAREDLADTESELLTGDAGTNASCA